MYRLKKILFTSYDLELYNSGNRNVSRVIPVFEFIDDVDLCLFASASRRNWDDYHDDSLDQAFYFIHENDIQEIEPVDISENISTITHHGKD